MADHVAVPAASALEALGTKRRWLERLLAPRALAATALTLLSLLLLSWQSDLPSFGELSSMTDYRWLALAALVNMLGLGCRAVRWQALYPPRQHLSIRLAASALAVGQVVNWAVPTRAGELVRIGMVTSSVSRQKVRRAMAIAAAIIVGEKLVDSIMLALAVAVLMAVGLPVWLGASGLLLVAAFCGLLLLLAIVLMRVQRRPEIISRCLRPALRLVPARARAALSEALLVRDAAFAWLGNGRWRWVALWSLGSWSMSLIVNYLILRGLSIDEGLGASLAVLVALYSGLAVPSLPGRLGVFQYLTVLALSPFGVGAQEGIAYALELYVVVYLPCALLGLLSVVILRSPLRWLIPSGLGRDV